MAEIVENWVVIRLRSKENAVFLSKKIKQRLGLEPEICDLTKYDIEMLEAKNCLHSKEKGKK